MIGIGISGTAVGLSEISGQRCHAVGVSLLSLGVHPRSGIGCGGIGAVAGSPCHWVERIFLERSVSRFNAIDRELIGRGVGVLFDPLALFARTLVLGLAAQPELGLAAGYRPLCSRPRTAISSSNWRVETQKALEFRVFAGLGKGVDGRCGILQ
jgi:hypothetical protein